MIQTILYPFFHYWTQRSEHTIAYRPSRATHLWSAGTLPLDQSACTCLPTLHNSDPLESTVLDFMGIAHRQLMYGIKSYGRTACAGLCPPCRRRSQNHCWANPSSKSTCWNFPMRHLTRKPTSCLHIFKAGYNFFFKTVAYLVFSLKKFQLNNIYYRVCKVNSSF